LNFGAGGITGSSDIVVDSAGAPVVIAGTNNATWTGNLIVQAGTAQLGANTAVPGVVSIGSGATFNFANNAAATVRGIQDYSGAGGTVTTPNSRALTVNGNGSYSFSGNITGANMGFTVGLGSSGVQTLSGSNSYGGATTINSGILNIRNDSALGTTVGSTSVALGATLQLEGGITVGNEALSILGFGAAGQNGALVNVSGTNSYGGQLTLLNNAAGNAISSDNSGTLNLTNTGTITNGNSRTLFLNGSGNGSLAGVLASGAITKNGTGTWTLTGANTYTGSTTINVGRLQLGDGNSTGSLSTSSAIVNNANLTINRSNAVAQGTDFSTAAITGTGSFTQAGTGTTTLNATNSYTGVTTVERGTLSFTSGAASATANQALGANATVILGVASTSSGTLNYTGAAGTLAKNVNVLGNGSDTIQNNGTGLLTVSGNVTNAGNLLTIGGSGNTTLSTGAVSGTGGIIKSGDGTLSMTGTNTGWSGGITIKSGTVSQGTNAASLGTGMITLGDSSISSNATLLMASSLTVANPITVAAGSSGTLRITMASGLAASSYTGAVTLNNQLTLGNLGASGGNTLTIGGGGITGSSDIIVDSAGAPVVIAGTNNATWTGNLIVQAGTAQLGGNAAVPGVVSIGSGATFDFRNNTAAAVRGIQDYSGAGGTVTTSNGNAGRVLTVNGNGTYAFSGNITGGPNTTGFTVALGSSGVQILSGTNTYSGATTISAGKLQIGNGGTTGTISITSAIVNNANLTINRSNAVAQGTDFSTAAITGTGSFTQAGTGTTTLNATNSYGGVTRVERGTLSFTSGAASATANQALGANATVILGVASTSSGTLNYTGAAGTLAKNVNVLGNGLDTIQNSGTGLLTLSGNLTKNGTILILKGGSNGINVTGAIAGSGANSDLIVDGGNTTLSGANTYNGPTSIINGATLTANGTNALPTTNGRTAVYLDQTVAGVATGTGSSILALGSNQSVSSLSGQASSTVNLNARTLTIGSASDTANFAGVISGANGALIKDSTGTQTLSGTNTYTGLTTISAGNITISNASALGSTTSGTTVASGAALQIQGGIAVGAEALNLTGSGFSNAGALRNLSGANSLSGAITLSGATTIGSDAGTLTLTGGISGTQNLTFTGAGNTTISGAIATSTGTLTKNGSGTTTLNAANTYTGTTTVNSGTLTAATANALGNSTVIDVNGGSFLVTAANAVNDNAAINLGGGTLAVSGTFNENVGLLTLSANSVIDLDGFNGVLRFGGVGSWASNTTLAIWNWNGINGASNRHVVFTNNSGLPNYLDRISFYSGSGSGFAGTGFEEGFTGPGGGTEIIAVPETETYFYAVALLAGLVIQYIRRRAKRKVCRLRLKSDPRLNRSATTVAVTITTDARPLA
jgi:autotransporter-associated beta strand protein